MRLVLKKTCCVFMLTVVLFTSVSRSYMQPLKVQASFLPAIGAWEVLQWILMSVGVTVVGIELLEDLADIPTKKAMQDSLIENLNLYKEGLGDSVMQNAETATVGAKSVSLARETWQDLAHWSKSVFADGTTARIQGNAVDIDIQSGQDMLDITKSILGTESIDANALYYLNMLYVKAAGRPLTFCHTYAGTPASYHEHAVWMYAENGGIASPEILLERSSNYLVLPDSQTMNLINLHDSDMWSSKYFRLEYSGDYFVKSNKIYLGSDLKIFETPILGGKVLANTRLQIFPGYRDKILEDDLVIVTPGTTVKDGTLVGDVVLPIPADLEDVLSDVIEGDRSIPDVLEDAKVFPVPDTDEAIQDALSKVEAAAPAIDKYKLSLAEFFPFCLPFDFVDFIQVLKADPVAPEFTISMPVGYSSTDGVLWQEYTINLSMFDQVAYWVRQFELLAFIVGLIMATRSMFIRS